MFASHRIDPPGKYRPARRIARPVHPLSPSPTPPLRIDPRGKQHCLNISHRPFITRLFVGAVERNFSAVLESREPYDSDSGRMVHYRIFHANLY